MNKIFKLKTDFLASGTSQGLECKNRQEYAAPNELRHIKSTLKAQRREFRLLILAWPHCPLSELRAGAAQAGREGVTSVIK